MKRRDDRGRSVLGLGGPAAGSELLKWRPSKAGGAQRPPSLPQREKAASEQNASAQNRPAVEHESAATPETNMPREAGENAPASAELSWRPSEAMKQRLKALAPVRRRRRFALPRSMRLMASAVLFVIGMYAFVKLWAIPTEMELHPALVVFAIALVLLLIAAIVSAVYRRRRAREDENSTLRL